MVLTVTLDFEEDCTIFSHNKANAFNSTYCHRLLPALAEIVPLAVPYASNLYAREPPKLVFVLNGGGSEVVESARRVQQRCNLGPLCYNGGCLKILKHFRSNISVPEARAVSFIDDITFILPRELPLDIVATWNVTEWLQERLGVEGISLNRRKSHALLADGVGPEHDNGRAACGNGLHRVYGGPTERESRGSTSWNRTLRARFLTGSS